MFCRFCTAYTYDDITPRYSNPPAEDWFLSRTLFPLSAVVNWSEFAREEHPEVSTASFERILAGYASLEIFHGFAPFARKVSSCEAEQALFSLFIENEGEQQIKVLAVLVGPETPNFVLIGEGTLKVDCHVAGEDFRCRDASRPDPLWELEDVLSPFILSQSPSECFCFRLLLDFVNASLEASRVSLEQLCLVNLLHDFWFGKNRSNTLLEAPLLFVNGIRA